MRRTKPKGVREPVVTMKDATFPTPFQWGLEFNSPAHGTWNIVHVGMQVPESHQIYVCAENCMRGVVLTAAEMKEEKRFSFVILEEEDLTLGTLEYVTIEGVTECINKLEKRPPLVMLFTVCVHHFLGCDLDYIYKKLEERFPDICFARCFMDPLLQKKGPTPEQKLRKSMFDGVEPLPMKERAIAVLGGDFQLEETSDIRRLVEQSGGELRELQGCVTYEDYLKLGECRMFINVYPNGIAGIQELGRRLHRKHFYMPMGFTYDEIDDHLKQLALELDIQLSEEWLNQEKKSCEALWKEAAKLLGDREIQIDYTLHPRPLGLARQLIAHGMNVTCVYLDAVSKEEQKNFEWLKENAPDLKLGATIHVERRTMERNEPHVLALGQKAAWFTGTRHFVNMVQGGGLYGYDGIRTMIRMILEAAETEKDTRDLIIRKGWGCQSCI